MVLRSILRIIRAWLFRYTYKPGKVVIYIIRGDKMGLVYKASLPPLGAPDVAVRTLELTVDGVKEFINVVPVDSKSIELPPVKEGATVKIRLEDIDDRGNASLWGADVTFVSADTIAPPAPGQVSVELVSEVTDKVEPAPAPVVEPKADTRVVDGETVLTPVE
jgi:hypothetical protein